MRNTKELNELLLQGLLGVKNLKAQNEIKVIKASLKREDGEEEFNELIREGLDLEEISDQINGLIN